jgi:SPP1 gp7 family putative phage head morphogenesis protein
MQRFFRKAEFARARLAERFYAQKLRKIARHIGDLVGVFDPANFAEIPRVRSLLDKYAQTLAPWAYATATKMITEVAAREGKAWRNIATAMGINIRAELQSARFDEMVRRLRDEQVRLITSLPTEAAERVHTLALEGLENGARAKEIAAEIMETGEVTKSRATLIARTEVGRTTTMLTQVRSEGVGATHYQWLSSRDSDVRPLHKKLDGQIFAWNDPPVADPSGIRSHPGCIWNCRCVALPIIPQ